MLDKQKPDNNLNLILDTKKIKLTNKEIKKKKKELLIKKITNKNKIK